MQGRHFSELDTPAYCVDLDIMAANMDSMSTFIKSHNKQWRPHVKCHKIPDIAQLQLQHGAIGVTSAKASEAEVFIRAGIESVLIANMIVGETKLVRVASLCHIGQPIVAVDHFVQAEALAEVCRRRSVTCDVIIELNVGLDRVG
ncbi:MAG: alanine racemase, partial [Planctomycetaceae bacterium]|nr:alanine racemase [Planctomycetaceae bacterium]